MVVKIFLEKFERFSQFCKGLARRKIDEKPYVILGKSVRLKEDRKRRIGAFVEKDYVLFYKIDFSLINVLSHLHDYSVIWRGVGGFPHAPLCPSKPPHYTPRAAPAEGENEAFLFGKLFLWVE